MSELRLTNTRAYSGVHLELQAALSPFFLLIAAPGTFLLCIMFGDFLLIFLHLGEMPQTWSWALPPINQKLQVLCRETKPLCVFSDISRARHGGQGGWAKDP